MNREFLLVIANALEAAAREFRTAAHEPPQAPPCVHNTLTADVYGPPPPAAGLTTTCFLPASTEPPAANPPAAKQLDYDTDVAPTALKLLQQSRSAVMAVVAKHGLKKSLREAKPEQLAAILADIQNALCGERT